MQAEHLWQLLHLHALLCFLQAPTGITAELVLCIQRLSGTAGPEPFSSSALGMDGFLATRVGDTMSPRDILSVMHAEM